MNFYRPLLACTLFAERVANFTGRMEVLVNKVTKKLPEAVAPVELYGCFEFNMMSFKAFLMEFLFFLLGKFAI